MLEEIKRQIKRGQKVLIQLPAGLRKHAIEIARIVKERGAEPIIWAGSCYGACDLPKYDCDVLLHFGHEKFTS